MMSDSKKACLVLACITGLMMPLSIPIVQAATPSCEATLTKDTKLNSDMFCPSRAINFSGARSKNVTLNCAGYIISSASGRVIDARSTSGITIKNCLITTSHDGGRAIQFTGVKNSKISGNTISTVGDASRGIGFRGGSSSNSITNNTVQVMGSGNGINFQASSNNNTVKNNEFLTGSSYAVNIQSSSNNVLTGNTLSSPSGYVYQSSFSLQNGGMAVDSAGNIYGVENNWGSRAGIGKATAFFQVDPLTGQAHTVMPLLQGGKDLKFGFSALDILPNGRVLALSDYGFSPDDFSPLYEIDPNTGNVTGIDLKYPQNTLNGLEATSNTTLLATSNRGDLMQIDLVTGLVYLVGEQDKEWTGVAIHPTSGKVYTVSRRNDEATNTAHLYEVDINTGQIISEIGDTGITSISGIDFAPDGTLYGNYDLVSIDITTGVGTTVGSFGPNPLEPLSRKNRLKNNVFQAFDGSVQLTDSITLPSVLKTDISTTKVEIAANQVMVDTAALPFLNEPARITLYDLTEDYRKLLVDREDDGSFVDCGSSQCKFISYLDGTLVFDVKGFTTYTSEEIDEPSLKFIATVVLAEINALLDGPGISKSSKKKLNQAKKDLSSARKFIKEDNLRKAFPKLASTVTSLLKIEEKVEGVDRLIEHLVEGSKSEAQAAIDTAIGVFGTLWLIAEAQADMAEASNKLVNGMPDKAISFYRNAWITARKAANPPTKFSIGDKGPAGGIVFYVTDGGRHGLEAAPNNQGKVQWGCYKTSIPAAAGKAVGTGNQNTIGIVANCSDTESTAAEVAFNYSYHFFNDWFLPSKNELNKLYNVRKRLGLCLRRGRHYWSSSEVDSEFAYSRNFVCDGGGVTEYKAMKFVPNFVRPIRAF